METKQQFSTAISNEEHLAQAKAVYDNDVRPHLKENRKAYAKYLQDKEALSLTPTQKVSI